MFAMTRSLRLLVAFIVGVAFAAFLAFAAFSSAASADHSWGSYHWARTSNPFTLKLGDNVNTNWDSYLQTTSSNVQNEGWDYSSALDTDIVAGGTNPKNCRATTGRDEVCNASYGNTGWLGVASIWASGSHITKGAAKLNDTYFNTAKYNTPGWRNMVMCQEVAHTFGLDHQDENFDNPNLGSCMDYTSTPDNEPKNWYPNQHDYDQLGTIYTHLDSSTTLSASTASKGPSGAPNDPRNDPGDDRRAWGREVFRSADGRVSIFELGLGRGEKKVTHVRWTEEQAARHRQAT